MPLLYCAKGSLRKRGELLITFIFPMEKGLREFRVVVEKMDGNHFYISAISDWC